jgi:uncharacterized protein YecA (UPF0149 family)
MRVMAGLLQQQRPPTEIMGMYAAADQRWRVEAAKAGRNEACPCGSGRKVKHCHGA